MKKIILFGLLFILLGASIPTFTPRSSVVSEDCPIDIIQFVFGESCFESIQSAINYV